jgi:Fe-S oxidoreductase
MSGKVLSPKEIIQDLKTEMERGWTLSPRAKGQVSETERKQEYTLIKDVISQEALWDCTTCVACVEACPVYVEHVDKMIDMRRGQVLADMDLPDAVRETLRNMEIRGNPWRGTDYLRDEWAKNRDIKVFSGEEGAEWLYWVGCTGALVDRNILVTRAFSELLRDAGIDFAILGNEEGCCGDPARRMGHELQFQMMAQQNIEVMHGYGIKKIVTHCPHCYNTLKHEYPQFGGRFDVWHHSELLDLLIRDKRLTLNETVDNAVTYHDPCYLGRYNRILDAPRNCLRVIPGLETVEMVPHGQQSFCCGGGGGHAWMEETVGQRINQIRMEQAEQTKADIIGVACPFCLQMMEEAISGQESSMKAMDLCEIIALSKSPENT